MKRLRHPYLTLFASTLLCWGLPQISYADASDLNTLASNSEIPSGSRAVNSSFSNTLPNSSAYHFESHEADLWERIRAGYAIPDLDNKLVGNQLTWYSTRTDYMLRTVQRASRYLFHVVEELEKRGMPTELALLPFIESAFNPQAISTAKASGMWQFMAATGKDFNLKQNMFKDDRRNVIESTDAALNYLERLHGMFGDWQLALAAYNWGEGSVQRAIKKQQALGLPVDYDSMAALMPVETRNYVPKLQAVKNIIAHPEQFNLALPQLDNQPYFVTVEKTRDIDVRVAAQLAELPLDEFTALNPQFNKPVITGGNNTKILLPADNADLFKTNLEKWEGPLSSWTAMTVPKTERVEALASRIGQKPETIREVNMIPAKFLVKAGSTILVPKSAKAAATQDQDIAPEVVENAKLVIEKGIATRQLNYRVGKKDSLASIAKHYKVSVDDIKEWNHLKTASVSSGQKLVLQVPVGRSSSSSRLASNSGHHKAARASASRGRIVVAHAGNTKSARKRHG